MKVLAAFALLFVGASASPDFSAWMAKHGKNYESEEELAYRRNIWDMNLQHVEAHNAEADAGRETYRLGMNKFADLTNAEFSAQYLRPRKARNHDSTTGVYNASLIVANSKDWRDVDNVVNPVKNQEQCGSCWSFSAVAAMEGAYNYKTGTLNSFSEQELVDCVKNGHYTCNLGGEMSDGIDYIANEMGGYIYLEDDYKYTASSCSIFKNCCSAEKRTGVNTGITGFTAVAKGDEDALKSASATKTIISIGIDASGVSFQLYESGVYNPTSCSSTNLDHGVAIVGYDTMSKGGDYWIVRNSWGRTWGEQGYVYMSRNNNNKCGVATDACFANI